jgi:hypothetical protein
MEVGLGITKCSDQYIFIARTREIHIWQTIIVCDPQLILIDLLWHMTSM